jgi:hypothetical protein
MRLEDRRGGCNGTTPHVAIGRKEQGFGSRDVREELDERAVARRDNMQTRSEI